ncbi:Gfo/Idh/MocA family protein [Pseudonocardia lutea]|uniref:Gfo/Idh/MocA family protein n=1 Tax=Pseudonocardia lutea TaxID=2172015 RepID=A0ABW1IHI8_9PSEU
MLHGLDEIDGVVLVDGRQDRLAALGRAFPGTACSTTLQEALPLVDAVVVATPPTTHVPLALRALEAGKHVLVEKPLATTAVDALRLIRAADRAERVLMVGHTFEYNAAVWKLRELVEENELGELYYIDSARLNLGLYQGDVNVVMDLAPHDISIINHVLGRPPVAVEAWGSRHAHRRFEDVAYLRLYFRDVHLAANIHVSWLDPCKVRRMTLVGSRKMAVYDDLAAEDLVRIHDKGVDPAADTGDMTQAPMVYRYGDITVPFLRPEEPLVNQDRHFADCCLTGRRPRTDGWNGLAVVEVLEALQLALQTQRKVGLDEVRDRRSSGSTGTVASGDGAAERDGHSLTASLLGTDR